MAEIGMSKNGKAAYQKYLQSDKWKTIRAQRLAMDNGECVLCGGKAKHVHHRRYPKEWGTETVNDLVCLCSQCHGKHHGDDDLQYVMKALGCIFNDEAMHEFAFFVKDDIVGARGSCDLDRWVPLLFSIRSHLDQMSAMKSMMMDVAREWTDSCRDHGQRIMEVEEQK